VAGMSSSSGRLVVPRAGRKRRVPACARYTPIRARCEGKLRNAKLLIRNLFLLIAGHGGGMGGQCREPRGGGSARGDGEEGQGVQARARRP
jgi:hypothetical protein